MPTTVPDMTIVRWDDHGEWAALYVNGVLQYVGDVYLVNERIHDICGVVYHRADFLRGGDSKNDAATTLEELDGYMEERDAQIKKAMDLTDQAQKLLEQAEEIQKKVGA